MQPDADAARNYALGRLQRELDPRLHYHSLAHTRDDVLPAAERLAALEGVDEDGLLDLRTAALFHDIGFVVGREEHEARGAQVAAAVLPGFGYTTERIDRIEGMIIATRLPQSPQTLLEQILADADLDVLGREDFFARNRALRAEVEAFDGPIGCAQWCRSQIRFISQHRYWTAAARLLRDPQKARNLADLRAALAGPDAGG